MGVHERTELRHAAALAAASSEMRRFALIPVLRLRSAERCDVCGGMSRVEHRPLLWSANATLSALSGGASPVGP
jgi:hypothetical protein